MGVSLSPPPTEHRVKANARALARAGANGEALARAFGGAATDDPDLASWSVGNPSPQLALSLDRDNLAGRIHDLARNDGWASGGVSRMVDAIIGSNWRLSSRPNWRKLGITAEAAEEVANQIEAWWKDFAEDIDARCDRQRRSNFGAILALAFRHRIWDGEAFVMVHWRPKPTFYSTCFEVVHPDRCSNPRMTISTMVLRDGVELDPVDFFPVAYHFRSTHPGDFFSGNFALWSWDRVEREWPWGRRIVAHAFEPQSAGDTRGTSPMAPILKKIRMLGRYDEAELQAAVLNAVLAAFVTTPLDGEQFAAAMGDAEGLEKYDQYRGDFHETAPVKIGGARVNFLAPGEDIKLTNPNHPNSVFEAFERTVLRNIATAIGVSYEQLSMDWSQVNYSSARAALIEIWRGFTARKEHFAAQIAQPLFAAWLEEAVDRGDIVLPKGSPSFREAKTAWCGARWIGPGRGWVDPLKEALASAARLEMSVSTLEDECAEQGKDWLDVLQQQAREMKERERLGLPALVPAAVAKATAAQAAEDGKQTPDKKASEKDKTDA